MQHLTYEMSWDKAIAPQDRQAIEQLFHDTKHDQQQITTCVPIRTAVNYKQQLLLLVLVHNFSEKTLSFVEKQVEYRTPQFTAQQNFTLPALTVPPYCSMPWTFIFAADSYPHGANHEHGKLTIL